MMCVVCVWRFVGQIRTQTRLHECEITRRKFQSVCVYNIYYELGTLDLCSPTIIYYQPIIINILSQFYYYYHPIFISSDMHIKQFGHKGAFVFPTRGTHSRYRRDGNLDPHLYCIRVSGLRIRVFLLHHYTIFVRRLRSHDTTG